MMIYIPIAIYLIPPFLTVGILFVWTRFFKFKKRTPLSQNLLRSPGESLKDKINILNIDVIFLFVYVSSAPILVYAMYMNKYYFYKVQMSGLDVLLISIIFLIFFTVILFLLVKKIKLRRNYVLGYEAELAIGQELNQLLTIGGSVYHDYMFDNFNIDHVVVLNNGVYAIETKGRAKPLSNKYGKGWEVGYKGKCLKFPGWVETKPIEQAKSQAKSLAIWLSSAVGENIDVKPIIMLPGWYIKLLGKVDVPINNGRQCVSFFQSLNGQQLSEKLKKQISHQLEQKCRNILPKAYSKEK